MTMRFEIKPHSVLPGAEMIEVYSDQQFIAAIYPGANGDSLRVISKYLAAATLDQAPPPAVDILLDLSSPK
jgi:hypothetical protein